MKLNSSMYSEFVEYAHNKNKRTNDSDKIYGDYITDKILDYVFNWMCNHNHNIDKYGTQFINGEFECSYSTPSILSNEEQKEDLFFTVWIKSEWAARGLMSFYLDTVKQYFGRSFKVITA